MQTQVFDRLNAGGYKYETIEVQQAHLDDNVARLAPLIKPNAIVLSAAGDGSAHAIFHTVIAANQPGVELGFLAYGNFNDIPNTFNTKDTLRDPVVFLKRARPQLVWPLTITVDDTPLRRALLYATAGWTAQAAAKFDDPAVRGKLTRGGAGLVKSLWRLGWHYLGTRRNSGLPAFWYGDKCYRQTDLIFANGPTVARLFKTGQRYYEQPLFLFRMLDVRGLLKNIPFLTAGLLGTMRGEAKTMAAVTFDEPASLLLQCDGEVVALQDIHRLTVRKAAVPLTILTTL